MPALSAPAEARTSCDARSGAKFLRPNSSSDYSVFPTRIVGPVCRNGEAYESDREVLDAFCVHGLTSFPVLPLMDSLNCMYMEGASTLNRETKNRHKYYEIGTRLMGSSFCLSPEVGHVFHREIHIYSSVRGLPLTISIEPASGPYHHRTLQ